MVVYTIFNNFLTENGILILSSQKCTNLYNFDHEEREQICKPASVLFLCVCVCIFNVAEEITVKVAQSSLGKGYQKRKPGVQS